MPPGGGSSITPNLVRALNRELSSLVQEPVPGCYVVPKDEGNLQVWHGAILGPQGTPYWGAVFFFDMTFDKDYPHKSPMVKLTSKIFHPNFYATSGDICLSILSKPSTSASSSSSSSSSSNADGWRPSMGIATVLLSVRLLIAEPNPSDAANTQAGQLLFRGKREEHDTLARKWIMDYNTYAGNDDATTVGEALKQTLPYGALWGDKPSFHEALKVALENRDRAALALLLMARDDQELSQSFRQVEAEGMTGVEPSLEDFVALGFTEEQIKSALPPKGNDVTQAGLALLQSVDPREGTMTPPLQLHESISPSLLNRSLSFDSLKVFIQACVTHSEIPQVKHFELLKELSRLHKGRFLNSHAKNWLKTAIAHGQHEVVTKMIAALRVPVGGGGSKDEDEAALALAGLGAEEDEQGMGAMEAVGISPGRPLRQDSILDQFQCPISKQILVDPVSLPCGRHTVSKVELVRHLRNGKKDCPLGCGDFPPYFLQQSQQPVNLVLRNTLERLYPNDVRNKILEDLSDAQAMTAKEAGVVVATYLRSRGREDAEVLGLALDLLYLWVVEPLTGTSSASVIAQVMSREEEGDEDEDEDEDDDDQDDYEGEGLGGGGAEGPQRKENLKALVDLGLVQDLAEFYMHPPHHQHGHRSPKLLACLSTLARSSTTALSLLLAQTPTLPQTVLREELPEEVGDVEVDWKRVGQALQLVTMGVKVGRHGSNPFQPCLHSSSFSSSSSTSSSSHQQAGVLAPEVALPRLLGLLRRLKVDSQGQAEMDGVMEKAMTLLALLLLQHAPSSKDPEVLSVLLSLCPRLLPSSSPTLLGAFLIAWHAMVQVKGHQSQPTASSSHPPLPMPRRLRPPPPLRSGDLLADSGALDDMLLTLQDEDIMDSSDVQAFFMAAFPPPDDVLAESPPPSMSASGSGGGGSAAAAAVAASGSVSAAGMAPTSKTPNTSTGGGEGEYGMSLGNGGEDSKVPPSEITAWCRDTLSQGGNQISWRNRLRLATLGLCLAVIGGPEDEMLWWVGETLKVLESGSFFGSGNGQEPGLAALVDLEEELNKRQSLAACDRLLPLPKAFGKPPTTPCTSRIKLAHKLLVRYHRLGSSMFGTSTSSAPLPITVRTAWLDRILQALTPPDADGLKGEPHDLLKASLALLADLVPASGRMSGSGATGTGVAVGSLEPQQQVVVTSRHRSDSPRPAVIQDVNRYDGTVSVVYQDDGGLESRLTPDRIIDVMPANDDGSRGGGARRISSIIAATSSSTTTSSSSDGVTSLLQRFLALAKTHDLLILDKNQPLCAAAIKVVVKLVGVHGIDPLVVLREVLLAPWLLQQENLGAKGLNLVRRVLTTLKDLPVDEEKKLKARLADVVLKALKETGIRRTSRTTEEGKEEAAKEEDRFGPEEEEEDDDEEDGGEGGDSEWLSDALWVLERCLADTDLVVSTSTIKASSGQSSAMHAFSSNPLTCWQSAGTPPHWIQARLPAGWGRVDFKCEAFDRGFAVKELVVLVSRFESEVTFKEVRRIKLERRQLQNQEWVTLLRWSDITQEMLSGTAADEIALIDFLDDEEMEEVRGVRRRIHDRRSARPPSRRRVPDMPPRPPQGGSRATPSSSSSSAAAAGASSTSTAAVASNRRPSSSTSSPVYIRIRVTQCEIGINCKVRQIRVLPFSEGEEREGQEEEQSELGGVLTQPAVLAEALVGALERLGRQTTPSEIKTQAQSVMSTLLQQASPPSAAPDRTMSSLLTRVSPLLEQTAGVELRSRPVQVLDRSPGEGNVTLVFSNNTPAFVWSDADTSQAVVRWRFTQLPPMEGASSMEMSRSSRSFPGPFAIPPSSTSSSSAAASSSSSSSSSSATPHLAITIHQQPQNLSTTTDRPFSSYRTLSTREPLRPPIVILRSPGYPGPFASTPGQVDRTIDHLSGRSITATLDGLSRLLTVTLEATDDHPEEVIPVPLPSARQAPQYGIGPWVIGLNTGQNSRIRFHGLSAHQVLTIGGGSSSTGFLSSHHHHHHHSEPSWRASLEDHEERHRQHLRQREIRRQQLLQYHQEQQHRPFGSGASGSSSSSALAAHRVQVYQPRPPATSFSGMSSSDAAASSSGFGGVLRRQNVDLRERVLAHLRETLGVEENDAAAMLDAMDEQTMMALITGGGGAGAGAAAPRG